MLTLKYTAFENYMLEVTSVRKNKISLFDYDYKRNMENRALIRSFSQTQLSVLEELLFSPIKTSVSKLSKDLKISEKQILPALEKLQQASLIKIDGAIVIIEKKTRKSFEFEFSRFDENFKPDLLFINNLLSKIPIHILPVWYCLSKTSNNIFQSIIDKYFLTPQIFQRHLEDLENENPIFSDIIKKLYNSPDFTLSSKEIRKKHDLDDERYLECLLLLEFNFICFQAFKKNQNGYEEVLIPFYEYTEYHHRFNATRTPSIADSEKPVKKRNRDFGFVLDLTSILRMAKKGAAFLQIENNIKKELNIKDPDFIVSDSYVNTLIDKLLQIKFLIKNQNLLQTSPSAGKWLELTVDHRALHFYYHPLNLLSGNDLPCELLTEKNIREAEKSIARVLRQGWVSFDDFIKGVMASISEDSQLKIKPIGKVYRYSTPSYSQEERRFIKKVIFERLFEAGIVNVGIFNEKDCFYVTKLGESLFDSP